MDKPRNYSKSPELDLPPVEGVKMPSHAEKLAKLLYGENRGDLEDAEALAIGDTVLNRVDSPYYQGTVTDVLYAPYQYSPFNPDDPNWKRIESFNEQDPLWQRYYGLAQKILEPGRKRTPFTHYFAEGIKSVPEWATKTSGLTRIGRHLFGTEDHARTRRRQAKQKGGAGVKVKKEK